MQDRIQPCHLYNRGVYDDHDHDLVLREENVRCLVEGERIQLRSTTYHGRVYDRHLVCHVHLKITCCVRVLLRYK